MLRPESDQDQTFRADFRAWLENNLPADLRHLTFRPPPQAVMPWYRKLARGGWVAPHWPRAFGGMEAKPVQQLIMVEELARVGAPDLPAQGLNHIGPILIRFGSDAQRQAHLPRILNGEAIWSQGYSEPGAGSDLAALRSKGRIDGQDIVINGHKIWTTWGHHADWMFALVRSGAGRSRRDGISFVLIDLDTAGITRRPIRNIAGDDEFCEVFFDEVRIPLDNIVGQIGGGWSIAMALLDEERIRASSPALALRALARLHAVVCANGLFRDPWALDLLARAEIEVAALAASYLDSLERFALGKGEGRDSSYLKILSTETTQYVLGILQELAGGERALRHSRRKADGCVDFSEMYLQSRRLSIYGGTNEIQRSLLAARALGLPKGGG